MPAVKSEEHKSGEPRSVIANKASWTDAERHVIAKYLSTTYTLRAPDFRQLEKLLPGRDAQQISDQFRRIVKPTIMSLYQPRSSVSASSTPTKSIKRQRSEFDDDVM